MSWLGRIFSGFASPEQKLENARRMLEGGRYNDARWQVDGIDHPEAAEIQAAALAGLAALNIAEAEARFTAGDQTGGAEHLEMAREFGAPADELRRVRRRARLSREAERIRKQQAEAEIPVEVMGKDPLWALPPDDPRLRFAMMIESYPEGVRDRLAALGLPFAEAVLRLEDGDPLGAYDALTAFVADEPASRYERARASLAANKLPAAVSDLAAFGDAVGHHVIGTTHTAALLAQLQAQLGRGEDAIATLDAHMGDPPQAGLLSLKASILEKLGKLEQAESTAVAALTAAPRNQGLYRVLARTRIRLGKRAGAMAALEAGLAKTCSSPGKCGNQPLDLDAVRMLAQLYLEDDQEPKRAEELLAQLAAHATEPRWEDRYLMALKARNEGAPDVPRIVSGLLAELPSGDPRDAHVRQHFAITVSA